MYKPLNYYRRSWNPCNAARSLIPVNENSFVVNADTSHLNKEHLKEIIMEMTTGKDYLRKVEDKRVQVETLYEWGGEG